MTRFMDLTKAEKLFYVCGYTFLTVLGVIFLFFVSDPTMCMIFAFICFMINGDL